MGVPEASWPFNRTKSPSSGACTVRTMHRGRARHRDRPTTGGDAPAPPHQPDRLLPRPQVLKTKAGRLSVRDGSRRRSAWQRPSAGMNASPPIGGTIRLAVDCMGGDHGPPVTCRPAAPSSTRIRATDPSVGPRAGLRPPAGRAAASSPRPRSSRWTIRSRWRCAQEGFVAARRRLAGQARRRTASPPRTPAISAGNTGALMAVSRYDAQDARRHRPPAIASVMPNQRDGFTTVLDLGANVDCTPSTCCSSP